MKKLFPIALVAVAAMTFTSCKKDYTCTCSYTVNSQTTTLPGVTIHETKSKATTACEGYNTTYQQYAGISCKLN